METPAYQRCALLCLLILLFAVPSCAQSGAAFGASRKRVLPTVFFLS